MKHAVIFIVVTTQIKWQIGKWAKNNFLNKSPIYDVLNFKNKITYVALILLAFRFEKFSILSTALNYFNWLVFYIIGFWIGKMWRDLGVWVEYLKILKFIKNGKGGESIALDNRPRVFTRFWSPTKQIVRTQAIWSTIFKINQSQI